MCDIRLVCAIYLQQHKKRNTDDLNTDAQKVKLKAINSHNLYTMPRCKENVQ